MNRSARALLLLMGGRALKNPTLVAASDASNWAKNQATYICDGTADEIEILAAIAALPAAGGTVILSEGQFNLADTVLISGASDITLMGMGPTTLLSVTTNIRAVRIDASDRITIRDLAIEGDDDPLKTLQSGIWVTAEGALLRANQPQILNCHVSNMGYDGITLLRNVYGGLVQGCIVENCNDDGINAGGTDQEGEGSHDTRIIGNYVSGCSGTGIHVSTNSRNTLVQGNVTVSCDTGIDFNDAERASIIGNDVVSCTTYGIAYAGADVVADGAIIGNNIYLCPRGINLTGSMRRFSIIGNNIRSATTWGIVVTATQDTHNVISGNTISDGITAQGIRLSGGGGNVISGNTITGITGSYSVFEADAAAGNLIEGNLVDKPIGQLGSSTVRGNVGHATEASGTATVANGATTATVTHGLGVTPTVDDIALTPTNNLGNATKFWISDPGATEFTVNVDADPGAGTATFAWQAMVL